MIDDLIKFHHAQYQEDLDYWISRTSGREPVLELGCAQGRVTLPLARAGRIIIGLDLAEGPLKDLEEDARNSALPGLSLVQADMLRMPLKGSFGAVILPCNTYSTFTEEQRILILRQIYFSLSPGGCFIASVPNPALLQKVSQQLDEDGFEEEIDLETTFIHPQTGNPVQVSSRLRPGPNCIRWDWIYDHLLPDGTTERFVRGAEHYLGSVDQYLTEIKEAGFRNQRLLGDFDENEYQEGSEYLIMESIRP